jgi:hypothetical protein
MTADPRPKAMTSLMAIRLRLSSTEMWTGISCMKPTSNGIGLAGLSAACAAGDAFEAATPFSADSSTVAEGASELVSGVAGGSEGFSCSPASSA